MMPFVCMNHVKESERRANDEDVTVGTKKSFVLFRALSRSQADQIAPEAECAVWGSKNLNILY